MTASKKQKPDVSFVMTVYNKEYYLPAVLKALLNQTGLKNPEYIFVDDLSKDRSVEIIEEMTRGIENVTIVRKDKNEGISISINRGIALARGEWVRMLDSDDIFPLNSTEKMLELANKHHADMVYGQFTKTGKEPMEIAAEMMPDDFDYSYKKDALRAVLKGRFTRMGQLIRRSVLQKAGGADERVFIQDESIPLRTAIYARGIVKIDDNVVLVPKEIGNFSGNKIQLDNDRFMAYCYAILDNPSLSEDALKLMYLRAVSAYWKYVKKTKFCPYLRKAFFKYLGCKLRPSLPDFAYLKEMQTDFLSLPHIRRVVNPLHALEKK